MPLSLLSLILALSIQEPAEIHPRESGTPRFEATSKVVLVPATVVDRRGALVSGLPRTAFSLTQDNKPQRIISFGEVDLPASVGIVLDVSSSMRGLLEPARKALRDFFDTCNPEDEAFLYTVSTRSGRDSTFTSDFTSLLVPSMFRAAFGNTALVDTIFAAMQHSKQGRNPRRALLVISDGVDNNSRHSAHELIRALEEADVPVYCISIFNPSPHKKPVEIVEDSNGIALLSELSRRSGGFHVEVRNERDIKEAAGAIGRAIRDQYLIGYVPEPEATSSNRRHSIQLKISDPAAKVYSRSGYYDK